MRRGDEGFTLVEAIAALALAAIAATGLMSTLGTSRARTVESEVRMLALVEARQIFAGAMAAANLNELQRQGQVADAGLAWTITLGEEDQPYPNVRQVSVAVRWTAAGKKGVTELKAYRFAPDA